MEFDNNLESLLVENLDLQSSSITSLPDYKSSILEIYVSNEPIVTINADGSHTFHKPDMIDEAARILWQAVSMRFTIMTSEEYDIINKEELNQLKRDAFELSCLHKGGVDNWEWYHLSLQEGGFFDEEIE